MQKKWEVGIGAVGFLFAMIALVFWFPNDIKGNFMEVTRAGVQEPGDAFFPILLASLIGFFSLIQLITGAVRSSFDRKASGYISARNVVYLTILSSIVLTSLALMYWTGPIVVEILAVAENYRQVIDTRPYKYIGYITGGFFMTFSLITWAEGQIRKRNAIVSALLLLLLISVFDLALNNIQLPPNADF